jgi:hypothetical protein
MKDTQLMVNVVLGIVLFVMFGLNITTTINGIFRIKNIKDHTSEFDPSHLKKYILIVVSIDVVCGIFNLIVSPKIFYGVEVTGLELLLLAAGLSHPMLYKKTVTRF